MRSILRLICVVYILIMIPCLAFAGVFDEFNGIKWGSKFPKSGFKMVTSFDDMKCYSRVKHDDLYGIPVSEVIYTINKGVFNAGHATFDAMSYKMVRQYLVNNYGQPVNAANRELFVVRSNGRTARAMLQQGLVNFTYQKN